VAILLLAAAPPAVGRPTAEVGVGHGLGVDAWTEVVYLWRGDDRSAPAADDPVSGRLRSAGGRSAEGGLVLNEVLADPPPGLEGDANGDGARDAADDEFVELVNAGTEPVDLAGWSIEDGDRLRHLFEAAPGESLLLAPGERATVFGGGDPSSLPGRVAVASSGSLGLANDGDRVALVDPAGAVADSLVYGSEAGNDESLIRLPDGVGAWTRPSDAGLTLPFTPQASNGTPAPVSPVTWGRLKRCLVLRE
jgi:hypothetical protein